MLKKILFIDRDGTLIVEPEDKQVDTLSKLQLQPGVISALLKLQAAGYILVMVSNQDGLGTADFPEAQFALVQNFLMNLFESQGIHFADVLICPHTEAVGCECRKPRLGLVMDYLRFKEMDVENSAVIGDRQTDMMLANNMGLAGILFGDALNWEAIADNLINSARCYEYNRVTKETDIKVLVNLDSEKPSVIRTGLNFFDHMLEQLAKQGGFYLEMNIKGDLNVDEHHTIEDAAIALGSAIKSALQQKIGIGRYGFLLPMDESLAEVAIDLCGRSYFNFEGKFQRDMIGDFPTEMVSHFFRSFAACLEAALHIKVTGENTHHMIEAIFKAVGKALKQAFLKESNTLPSTKGVL